jgi:ubiquitin-like 1-activating enzyme E1 B
VFNSDIKNLLIMTDMWKSRSPPTVLDYDAILNGTFTVHNGTGSGGSGQSNGASTPVTAQVNGSAAVSSLRDQRALSLKDNLDLFVSR